MATDSSLTQEEAFPRAWIRTVRMEMHSNECMTRPAKSWPAEAMVERWREVDLDDYLALYHRVGDPHGWGNCRLLMDRATLQHTVERSELYRLRVHSKVAGFAELVHTDADTELKYFGLAPEYCGRGFGSAFLAYVLACTWRIPLPAGYPALAGETTSSPVSEAPSVPLVWLVTCENE
jgi:GNAT superfamily N-acetyltransferase